MRKGEKVRNQMGCNREEGKHTNARVGDSRGRE